VIKSRSLKWVGHVVKMEEDRSAFKILIGTPYSKETFREASGVDGRTILE
jgi:hypothetical protein